MLRAGRVTVNGAPEKRPETQLDPAAAAVCIDGAPVVYKQYLYIMLHKPAGIVSASSDSRTPTVIDLLPERLRRPGLFPAGRLDKDTTGFVLITDDGAFAHNMLSPARHVEKTYLVTLPRLLTRAECDAVTSGLTVGDTRFRPAKLRLAADGPAPQYEIVLTEGKYHQIKRMFGSLGAPVTALHRTKLGGLELDPALRPGECRELTAGELRLLTERAEK